MNSSIGSRISAGFVTLTLLAVLCGGAGYYGIDRLADSLEYVTGPAWNTADGAMEASIGTEAEVIAINAIVQRLGDEETARAHLADAREMARGAFEQMAATGLIDPSDLAALERARQRFDRASSALLDRFRAYSATRHQLEQRFHEFQQIVSLAEEIGDSQVEELERSPDRAESWAGGLERRWTAADGTMEAQIGLLQRIFYFQRLINGEDEAESLQGLSDARAFMDESMQEVIAHPVFRQTRVPAMGDTSFSTAIEARLADHHRDFDAAVEQFRAYRDAQGAYADAMRGLLDAYEVVEEQGDATIEGELAHIGSVITSATTVLAATILASVVLAAISGYVIVIGIVRPLRLAVQFANSVESGELTSRIEVRSRDETGQLAAALGAMQTRMHEVIVGIRDRAGTVSSTVEQVASGNADLHRRTQEQSASLIQISSTMEEMASTVAQTAANAQEADELAASTRSHANRGGEVVARAVAAMDTINDSSRRIGDIIGVIDEIAFQTNLLALNAAVEAARAGDSGRGFAVVAGEVRNLAGRSADAAREIKSLISDSVHKVRDGTRLVSETGTALDEIVASVNRVSEMIAGIAVASREQSDGIGQINQALSQMDDVTQRNALLVREAAVSGDTMGAQARELIDLVAYFDVGDEPGNAMRDDAAGAE